MTASITFVSRNTILNIPNVATTSVVAVVIYVIAVIRSGLSPPDTSIVGSFTFAQTFGNYIDLFASIDDSLLAMLAYIAQISIEIEWTFFPSFSQKLVNLTWLLKSFPKPRTMITPISLFRAFHGLVEDIFLE